jgi:ankyrin repeat protein
VIQKHFEVVYESDVNMQDGAGRTAMHHSCMNKHLDTVKVLLSVLADTYITDDNGRTLETVCAFNGSPELANYIQHNLPMYVPGDDDKDSNITASGQVDNINT